MNIFLKVLSKDLPPRIIKKSCGRAGLHHLSHFSWLEGWNCTPSKTQPRRKRGFWLWPVSEFLQLNTESWHDLYVLCFRFVQIVEILSDATKCINSGSDRDLIFWNKCQRGPHIFRERQLATSRHFGEGTVAAADAYLVHIVIAIHAGRRHRASSDVRL